MIKKRFYSFLSVVLFSCLLAAQSLVGMLPSMRMPSRILPDATLTVVKKKRVSVGLIIAKDYEILHDLFCQVQELLVKKSKGHKKNLLKHVGLMLGSKDGEFDGLECKKQFFTRPIPSFFIVTAVKKLLYQSCSVMDNPEGDTKGLGEGLWPIKIYNSLLFKIISSAGRPYYAMGKKHVKEKTVLDKIFFQLFKFHQFIKTDLMPRYGENYNFGKALFRYYRDHYRKNGHKGVCVCKRCKDPLVGWLDWVEFIEKGLNAFRDVCILYYMNQFQKEKELRAIFLFFVVGSACNPKFPCTTGPLCPVHGKDYSEASWKKTQSDRDRARRLLCSQEVGYTTKYEPSDFSEEEVATWYVDEMVGLYGDKSKIKRIFCEEVLPGKELPIKAFVNRLMYCCDVCGCYKKPMKLCGRCKLARYCSSKCQKRGWKTGHKHVCVPPEKAVVARESYFRCRDCQEKFSDHVSILQHCGECDHGKERETDRADGYDDDPVMDDAVVKELLQSTFLCLGCNETFHGREALKEHQDETGHEGEKCMMEFFTASEGK